MLHSIDEHDNKRSPHPAEMASFLSKCSFMWLIDLFKFGLRNQIMASDIYCVRQNDSSAKLSQWFTSLWMDEVKNGTNSLWNVIKRAYGCKVFLCGLAYSLVDSTCRVLQPQFLGGLISYFTPNQTQINATRALYYALGIILCSLIPVLVFHPFFLYVFNIGQRIRIACCALLYQKVLKFRKSTRIDGLNGELINLMSNDVARFDYAVATCHDIYKGPLEAVLLGYFIYREIGVSGLFGIGCLLFFVPLLFFVGNKAAVYRLRTTLQTDKRVHLMSEIIQGIKAIKTFCLEQPFAKMIKEFRGRETKGIRGTLFLWATIYSFNFIAKLSIFICLMSFLNLGNHFTASSVYIVMSYFNMLFTSMLQFWPLLVAHASEAFVAIKRVQNFLLYNEQKLPKNVGKAHLDDKISECGNDNVELELLMETKLLNTVPPRRIERDNNETTGIVLRNISASWSGDNVGFACDYLEILEHKTYGVIGLVGSGKSTLLQVILGELDIDSGMIEVNGTFSYASQEPWMFYGTIRQNIVFSEQFEAERYQTILNICALESDIESFPFGDLTFIGDHGTNLSGGQKSRINLARCLYRNADIYLLDDPFASLDVNVSKFIFEKVVKQFLKNKICVMVTHCHQFLNEIDNFIVINMGSVEVVGTYKDLKDSKSFEQVTENDNEVQQNSKEQQNLLLNTNSIDDDDDGTLTTIANQQRIDNYEQLENQISGKVEMNIYKKYLSSVDSKWNIVWVGMLMVLAQLATSGVDFFISFWVNRMEGLTLNRQHNEPLRGNFQNWVNYIYFYAIAMCLLFYFSVHRSFAFFKMCLRASVNLHDRLFCRITRASIGFFQCIPSGRILNRFARDIGIIDIQLPIAMYDCALFFLELAAILIIVAIVNYWLLLPTIIMALSLCGLRYVYINTSRSLKRVESLTRSPIYSHVNSTFHGLSTIHSTRSERILMDEFHHHTDLNSSAMYLYMAATRAFAFWLEVVCVIYIGTVTLSFIAFDHQDTLGGNVGLAITQVLNLIFFCQWGIRQTAELENQMTSVERILEYQNIKMESPFRTPNKFRPSKDWPQTAQIVFANFYLKYTPAGDYVLKDLNFKINSGEKISIVGRTGAGKSSIIQALFRFAINEGSIEIDDINIETLGLHDLRRAISLIPQDPTLFSAGTIRTNLDPFDERTDDEIWDALEQVEMKEIVSMQYGNLSAQIGDSAQRLSSGERQLLCLARAFIRKSKILILDEATANIHPDMDNLIHETIQKKFSNSTILTIAHRLNGTTMDCDKIMVLDGGRIIEFAHPYELIQHSRGYFRLMVDRTGYANAINLIKIAEKSYFTKNTN